MPSCNVTVGPETMEDDTRKTTKIPDEGVITRIKKTLVLFGTILFIGTAANANPVLNNVAAGNVSVQQSPGNTQINQTSQQAILNWNSFNIGASEQTHFQQPAGGIALNRIDPNQGASQVFGTLTATGKIILVNQAGIFFGSGAHVDVGGIIASTSDISNANFLAGKYSFDQPSSYGGSIVNRGTIIAAQNGLVALVGTSVSNEGLIRAHMGQVVLASGNKFTVSLSGDDLINFAVDEGTSRSGVSPVDGSTMRDGVSNSGRVIANGGTILMTARTAKNIVDNAINMSGVAVAHSVHQVGGQIILSGGNEGVVRVSGRINVSGRHYAQKGGSVIVTGQKVLVAKGAKINASGQTGGGTISIGGNAQGATPLTIFNGAQTLANAQDVYVAPGSYINADAITNGNGGHVVVWADDATQFYGNISAQGGAQGGNGGYVETSGHYLVVDGAQIDLAAANGTMGTWLLDPANVTISTGSDTGYTNVSNTLEPNSAAPTATINTTTLDNDLATNNIVITTTNNGTTGGSAGTITLAASSPLSWTSSSTLTLTAASTITLNSSITALNGGLTLNATNNSAITTGDAGTINVANFTLTNGQWSQTGTLPSFAATNNFQLNGGSFLRATGGSGTSGSPYQIADIYGLQGTATLAMSNSYILANNIDASVTANWNSGSGFVPIGKSATPYTGTFNGANNTINYLYENITSSVSGDIGLFGDVSTGTVKNVNLSNETINVGLSSVNVGGLVGDVTSTGTLTNVSTGGTISLINNPTGNIFIGGIVGQLNGTLNGGSYSTDTITANSNNVTNANGIIIGGAVGEMPAGTASSSYSAGSISSTITGTNTQFFVGGFAGYALGGSNINNDYSTTSISATSTANSGNNNVVGGFIGVENSNTALTNSYSSGSVASNLTGTSNNLTGGFVGQVGSSANVTKDLWDVVNSGQASGFALNTGSVSSLYGGCMAWGGTCGLTTISNATNSGASTHPVDLSLLATYTTAGWSASSGAVGSITSTVSTGATAPTFEWFIFPSETRPLLLNDENFSISAEWSTNIKSGHQLQLMGTALGASYQLVTPVVSLAGIANAADVWGGLSQGTVTGGTGPQGFVPVGNGTNTFTGSFNGLVNGSNGTISNLIIPNTTTQQYVGLFGFVGNGSYTGEIQNLTLSYPSIAATDTTATQDFIGGIAGKMQGATSGTVLLNNDTVTGGTISLTSGTASVPDVGGLIGQLNLGTVQAVSNSAAVSITDYGNAGGIIGVTSGNSTITSASNSGAVQTGTGGVGISGDSFAGGIVGLLISSTANTISNSNNSGNISGGPVSDVGGIVGQVNSSTGVSIVGSYNTGSIGPVSNYTTMDAAGGLVGTVYASALTLGGSSSGQASFNLGSVTGGSSSTSTANSIGGLVGWFANGNNGTNNALTINYSYNAGAVSAGPASVSQVNPLSVYVGGLLGNFLTDGSSTTGNINITNAYNVGTVTGGFNGGAGGLIGGITATSGTAAISGSYNSGFVSGTNATVGALTGSTNAAVGALIGTVASGAITPSFSTPISYYDSSIDTGLSAVGSGSATNVGSNTAALTTSQFLTSSNFSGWSFGSTPSSGTWYNTGGNTRPILQAEYSTTITSPHQLDLINMSLTSSYTLAGNIDLTNTQTSSPSTAQTADVWGGNGIGFLPIGQLNTNNGFTGNFNGKGYVIQNLNINQSGFYAGLFGLINNGSGTSTIQNVGLINVNITDSLSNSNAGGLIGQVFAGGAVSNAFVTGTVSGNQIVGGLVGDMNGSINTSYSNAHVISTTGDNVGGLVGILGSGSISDSYSLGSVTITSGNASSSVGGLVGINLASITNSYSTGSITESGGGAIGGFIGNNSGSISKSFWDTATSGTSTGVGSGSSTGVTGGTFTGSTGATLDALSTYSNAGWNIDPFFSAGSTNTTWYIDSGFTRPILGMEYSTTVNTAHALQLINKDASALTQNYAIGTGVTINASGTSSSADVWGTTGTIYGFIPIGPTSNPFTGNFNGNSNTISNLSVTNNSASGSFDLGLFGYVGGSTSISELENVTLSSPTVLASVGASGSQSIFMGDLAGYIQSNSTNNTVLNNITISNANIHITSDFGGTSGLGGVVGEINSGTATNITVSGGSVDSQNGVPYGVGGVVGLLNAGTVSNSSSSATVFSTGYGYVGGIAGIFQGGSTISSSSNSGTVQADQSLDPGTSGNNPAGGLVGLVNGGTNTISSSSNSGAIDNASVVADAIAGGIVGWNAAGSLTISGSYNTSTGSIGSSSNNSTYGVGGLVGYNSGTALTIQSGSFNLGTVTGNNAAGSGNPNSVGGLVGLSGSGTLTIQNSYNGGNVFGTGSGGNASYVGGLLGNATGGSVTINNTYSYGSVGGPLSADNVGGLIGGTSVATTIGTSYDSGPISGGAGGNKHGLVGNISAGTTTANYDFWDITTTNSGTDLGAAGTTGTGVFTNTASASLGEITSWFLTNSNFPSQWTFTAGTGNWYQINLLTRPILQAEYSTNIVTSHQLELMSMNLNASYTLGGTIDLTNTEETSNNAKADIWSSAGWVPVGASGTPFLGSLNGQNNTIENLNTTSAAATVGLFGLVGNSSYTGEIQNLTLSSPLLTYSGSSAIYAGILAGEIQGASNSTNVLNNIQLTGSSVAVQITTGNPTNALVGGMVGYLNGGTATFLNNAITNGSSNVVGVYATNASTPSTAGVYVGGLIGYMAGATLSYSTNQASFGSLNNSTGVL